MTIGVSKLFGANRGNKLWLPKKIPGDSEPEWRKGFSRSRKTLIMLAKLPTHIQPQVHLTFFVFVVPYKFAGLGQCASCTCIPPEQFLHRSSIFVCCLCICLCISLCLFICLCRPGTMCILHLHSTRAVLASLIWRGNTFSVSHLHMVSAINF